jgi:hypothetical protein
MFSQKTAALGIVLGRSFQYSVTSQPTLGISHFIPGQNWYCCDGAATNVCILGFLASI